jgi:hypothetical protein
MTPRKTPVSLTLAQIEIIVDALAEFYDEPETTGEGRELYDYFKRLRDTVASLEPELPMRPIPEVQAARIVDAIVADLMGRSGLGDAWDRVSKVDRLDIRSKWMELARNILVNG